MPAGNPSNTARPRSVRVVRPAGPASVTFASGMGEPDGSETTTAKVTAPPLAGAPRRWASGLATDASIKKTAGQMVVHMSFSVRAFIHECATESVKATTRLRQSFKLLSLKHIRKFFSPYCCVVTLHCGSPQFNV